MAYIDSRVGSATATALGVRHNKWNFCRTYRIDCATSNLGAGEINYFMTVPAGTVIEGVLADVVTVEDSTLTFHVGDFSAIASATTAAGYINGANGETASLYLLSHNNGESYAAGKAYLTASILGFTAVNAADTAVIDVTVFGWTVPPYNA